MKAKSVLFKIHSAKSIILLLPLFLGLALLTNCGGGGSTGTAKTTPGSSKNTPPTVTIGTDFSTVEGSTVTLTADAKDSDGTIASYDWKQLSGTTLTVSQISDSQISFVAPELADASVSEEYMFQVTVTDNDGASSSDSDTITVLAKRIPPPTGPCSFTISPGDSFSDAFSIMQNDDILCLNDGIYQQAMDIPSNIHVRAVNDGMAEIDGGGTLGEAWTGALLQMHGSNSSVRGLKVHHAGENSDTCHVSGQNNTMQFMSCSHGGFHKHKLPIKVDGSGHLIEDSWAYGEGRYVIQCFIGNNITFRRNVVRWDSTVPNEPTEPNAAIAIYNCSDITIENNISLDYGTPETAMRFGGDFYSPQHPEQYPTGNQNNQWLGNIAINHAPGTDNRRGLRLDPDTESFDNIVRDFYVKGSDLGILSNDKMTGLIVENCTFIDVGIETSIPGMPSVNCGSGADISVRYKDRIKTSEPLFPFAQEGLIKRDMCNVNERQSDWCLTNKSLTEYILN